MLLLEEPVLSHQASLAVGVADMKDLATEYLSSGRIFEACKTKLQIAILVGFGDPIQRSVFLKEACDLLQQEAPLTTRESQQLEFEVLSQYDWTLLFRHWTKRKLRG